VAVTVYLVAIIVVAVMVFFTFHCCGRHGIPCGHQSIIVVAVMVFSRFIAVAVTVYLVAIIVVAVMVMAQIKADIFSISLGAEDFPLNAHSTRM